MNIDFYLGIATRYALFFSLFEGISAQWVKYAGSFGEAGEHSRAPLMLTMFEIKEVTPCEGERKKGAR